MISSLVIWKRKSLICASFWPSYTAIHNTQWAKIYKNTSSLNLIREGVLLSLDPTPLCTIMSISISDEMSKICLTHFAIFFPTVQWNYITVYMVAGKAKSFYVFSPLFRYCCSSSVFCSAFLILERYTKVMRQDIARWHDIATFSNNNRRCI